MKDDLMDYLEHLEYEDNWNSFRETTKNIRDRGKTVEEAGGEEQEDSPSKKKLQKKFIRRLQKLFRK